MNSAHELMKLADSLFERDAIEEGTRHWLIATANKLSDLEHEMRDIAGSKRSDEYPHTPGSLATTLDAIILAARMVREKHTAA